MRPPAASRRPGRRRDEERQADGHDEVEVGDDVVGLEEAEGRGGVDLAELGDVLDAQRRDQGRILDHGDEVVAERRQHGPHRLGENDEAHDLPALEAEGGGRLDLTDRNRLDAGAEDLGDEGRVAHRQRDDRPPGHVEVADAHLGKPARRDRRGKNGIPERDDLRGTDEGDVEKQDQDGNAADDLDVEGGDLAQQPAARQAAEGDDEAERRRQREGDERHPERDKDALPQGVEDGRVVAVGGDQPGEDDAEEDDREQPIRDLAARMAGIGGTHRRSGPRCRRLPYCPAWYSYSHFWFSLSIVPSSFMDWMAALIGATRSEPCFMMKPNSSRPSGWPTILKAFGEAPM